jgi:uncharacterized membrane protein
MIERLATNLQPGITALFLLIRKMTTDKVPEALKGMGGTVLTPLDHTKEQALREALAAPAVKPSPIGSTQPT